MNIMVKNINSDSDSDSERSKKIRKAIVNYGKEIRLNYPILKYQDALGLGILIMVVAIMFFSSLFYINDYIPWWVCIIVNTLCISVAHEIEHDLIHNLYFKKNRIIHNLMMMIVWIVRPSSANPWVRRKIHLNHHQVSGTYDDLEERLLANGMRWGLFRLWMTSDFIVAVVALIAQGKSLSERWSLFKKAFKAFFPFSFLHSIIVYVFIIFNLTNVIGAWVKNPIYWSEMTLNIMNFISFAMVIIMVPNIIWTFCLHFISSSMHYYGDNESGNIVQETQVLNPWWLWPFHLFCFNFGSTHSIHHFVVNEPFYIRQLSVPVAHKIMKEMGVRFNDFGSFRRANRWGNKDIVK
ncbi:fatty acid desaturase [Yersinia wautersii]|uniref:fatty acid desaturase n=1 Tax=Yersinia wautersii TaxID=1341643 RepID=UPI00041B5BDA|nr:fatty acid desaturase [Yersinia wautersii]